MEQRVPCGSVVKCLTRNPGVLGSSRTGSFGFFHGSVLGQDTSEPSLLLVKPRKVWKMWAVAVIWLKYCWKRHVTPFNQPINQMEQIHNFLSLIIYPLTLSVMINFRPIYIERFCSQWQLNKVWKLNYSVHELFIFRILLIAIDWNF